VLARDADDPPTGLAALGSLVDRRDGAVSDSSGS
jgi:hypothetical protein